MLKKKFFKIILLSLFFLSFSCSRELDFNQAEELTTSPEITLALGFFNAGINNFSVPPGGVIPPVVEIIEYRVFENEILRDNLTRQDFNFKIDNTFSRAFVVSIELLNRNNSPTFRPIVINVDANSVNNTEEVIINNIREENSNVKNTERLRLIISLVDSTTPIGTTTVGNFNFQSSTKLYLETSISE